MAVKNITLAALIALTAAGAAAAGNVSPGRAQLAKTLGVASHDLSLAELTALNGARTEGDEAAFNAILAKNAPAANTVASAGNLQRAAALGVQPGRFTTAELTQLETAKRDNDTHAWNFIVSGENRVVAEKGTSVAATAILAETVARGSNK